jgi:hypothetical protein
MNRRSFPSALMGRLALGRRGVLVAALLAPTLVSADAIMRTQAMFATTIAEAYVQEGRAELELEIGLKDLQAFSNLLPDELYERLGNAPVPFDERITTFFAEDLVIGIGDGPPLVGRILEMNPGERVRRDEITGEPLPVEEEEPETVIRVRLAYSLRDRPAGITLGGAISSHASIGFVLYHESIAVNDFRYLTRSQTVVLDWDDPFYSKFRERALRRTYFAPMNGYIYVEPYEVRKEIIVRPKDLQSWIDLGIAGRRRIPVEIQDELKRTVAEFLRERQPVTIDGETPSPELAQINFLERTLRSSRVIDPAEELDTNSAILGAIFVYPTDGLPDRVTMEWDLFNERIRVVPAAAVDEAGPFPSYLEPDLNVLEWQNFLKNPTLPTMMAVSSPPGTVARWAARMRWPLVVVVLLLVGAVLVRRRARRERRRGGVAPVAIALILAAGCFWIGSGARLSEERTEAVVSSLLHNIYRAFDFRDEERIYDVLETSVAGDLLTEIYLETRRGLELANQGGARAKVKEMALVELEAEPAAAGGFRARATWIVAGSVGHWGHVHQRRNQYRADLNVRPVNGAWKLTGIEVLEEERL